MSAREVFLNLVRVDFSGLMIGNVCVLLQIWEWGEFCGEGTGDAQCLGFP